MSDIHCFTDSVMLNVNNSLSTQSLHGSGGKFLVLIIPLDFTYTKLNVTG